jgi:ribosomal protein L10
MHDNYEMNEARKQAKNLSVSSIKTKIEEHPFLYIFFIDNLSATN